jgi:hypothetical protein
MRPNCDRSLISSASDCTNARLPFDATILCGALELKFLIDGVSRSLRGNRFCSSSRSTNSIHPSQIEVIWRLLNKLYPCERCHGGRGRVSCMPPATPANPVEPSQPSQDKQAPCEPRVRERVPRRGGNAGQQGTVGLSKVCQIFRTAHVDSMSTSLARRNSARCGGHLVGLR